MTHNHGSDHSQIIHGDKLSDMQAFDQLPALIRTALNYAPFPFYSPQILEVYRGGMSISAILQRLEEIALRNVRRT